MSDETMKLMHGDCLELMKNIPDGSIDMVLCDLPYGTTRAKWDVKIPFMPLWDQYKRIVKTRGAIVLFSAEPFTSELVLSNKKMFRYDIIWTKKQPTGFLNAKKMPLRCHENILIFYKALPTYNPQMWVKENVREGRVRKNSGSAEQYREFRKDNYRYKETGKRYPLSFVNFSNWNGALFGDNSKSTKHPTQKPTELLEYLIQTYTHPGETVLDNCMGAGSTGIACLNTGREFIGIELDPEYYRVAKERIEQHISILSLMKRRPLPEPCKED